MRNSDDRCAPSPRPRRHAPRGGGAGVPDGPELGRASGVAVLTVGALRRALASVSDDILVTIAQPEPGGWYWHAEIVSVPTSDDPDTDEQPTVILGVSGDFHPFDL